MRTQEQAYYQNQQKELVEKYLLMAESYICSVSQPDEEGDRPCWNWPKEEKFNTKLSNLDRLSLAIDLIQKAQKAYVQSLS